MKCMLMVLFLVAMSWGITVVTPALGEEQAVRANKVTEKVRTKARDEKMMPAPEVQLKRLTKGLELTKEQQQQIQPVLEDEYAKLKEIRLDEDLSPKQIQKKVQALRSGTVSKIQTYLTAEQKEKYLLVSNEIKSYKQKRMKDNRKDRIGTKGDPSDQSK